jgi:hypothetical protein
MAAKSKTELIRACSLPVQDPRFERFSTRSPAAWLQICSCDRIDRASNNIRRSSAPMVETTSFLSRAFTVPSDSSAYINFVRCVFKKGTATLAHLRQHDMANGIILAKFFPILQTSDQMLAFRLKQPIHQPSSSFVQGCKRSA